MFFVPVAILVIEDEDDRTFMENLYSSYHRLMYHTIHLITEDPWITEDILQSTTEKLIQNLDTIKHLPQPKLVNYIIFAINIAAQNEITTVRLISKLRS